MTIDAYELWVFLAGALAGLAIGIQIDSFREVFHRAEAADAARAKEMIQAENRRSLQ